MPASPPAAPSPVSPSFAGLLAELASPDRKFPPARDLDGLEDDIATLSYEHALRAHARHRTPTSNSIPPAATDTSQPAESRLASTPPVEGGASAAPSSPPAVAAGVEQRRTASVTVRLSRTENDQLRERAAEAGMTISAYLRSCAFEVETLRAQVKQTVAELRRGSVETPRPSWLGRLLPWKKRGAVNASC